MDEMIDKLTAEQALEVVKRLVRKGHNTRDAVIAEAQYVLTQIDLAQIAEEVFSALDSIAVEDCWDRSGGSHHGYTSPDEAAVEIVEEEMQPFIDQVKRYHDLGMIEQETAYCMGVVSGLYRYERESKSEFRAWCEDVPGECAGGLLDDWQERNREAARRDGMNRFVQEYCPDWAKWLKVTMI